jgi:hypothetical protein
MKSTRWTILLLASVIAWPVAGTTDDQTLTSAQTAPDLIVVLRPGVSTVAYLSWARSTGRMPVTFLGPAPGGNALDFTGRSTRNVEGLTIEYDAAESESVQASLNLAEYHLEQSGGTLTVAAVRIRAAADAPAGVSTHFLTTVSGTARDMLLIGKITILIRE